MARALVLLVVYGLFLGFFAQTLGMRLLRIRCVSMATGGPIGVPRAILRGALLLLFVPALIMDKDGRGLQTKPPAPGWSPRSRRPSSDDGSAAAHRLERALRGLHVLRHRAACGICGRADSAVSRLSSALTSLPVSAWQLHQRVRSFGGAAGPRRCR